ncbi:hypothetical protein AYL99_00535 [Fonsecaea erecta]|uniref:Chromo domain-containing protein n=1 Tax=Fonsecaea erecta TaxID=1367422 RepID=A0A178ZZC3_9EURO|nr:hypothetical protein AYL99_00535 [Fonsecaea erecta]OAP64563.1 hypothetical protein AYL99_00535 [Fonsecaea erecta]
MKKRPRSKSSTHGSTPRKRPKRRSENHGSPEEPESLTPTPDEPTKADDFWPVEKICRHRLIEDEVQYLVQWAPHPVTGETYRRNWRDPDDVTDDLIQSYWAEKKAEDREKKAKRKSTQSQKKAERKSTQSQKKAERKRKSDSNTPSRRSEQEKDRQASEQPKNPPPGQAGTDPRDYSQADVDLTLFTESGFCDEPDNCSEHSTPPAPPRKEESTSQPTSNSEPESALKPEAESKPDSKSVSEFNPDSTPESVVDLWSGIEPGPARESEPEGERGRRSRSGSESGAEAEQESARSPSRLDGAEPSEANAPISQEPSGSAAASTPSSIPPILPGSAQERGGEPDPEQDRGLAVGQTEAAHTLGSAPTSPRRTPRPGAADLAAAARPAEPSSVPRPVPSEVEPHDRLSEQATRPVKGLQKILNLTSRPAWLTTTYLAKISPSALSPKSDAMDPPTHPTLNSSGIVPRGAHGDSLVDDGALGGSALPIQDSIESEEPTLHGEQFSSDSKASSSQQSVQNERDVPRMAELVPQSLPILGPAEYAVALPCDGKIQSIYSDIITSKEKAIKKFLSRHEPVSSATESPARTQESIEMNELIQRLHDTVTHMDLGLPGIATPSPHESQEDATYANYASMKFSFLGHLVDVFKSLGCSIVIMAREGPIQDLLENYLKMKQITVKRQDRMVRAKPDRISTDFQVDLVSTWSTHQVAMHPRPIMMIAFDSSFDSQDPQAARIRAHFSYKYPALMPVVHLVVANSSEHVDRCLPKSMPAPMRLKALVRATYQAWPNLGRQVTFIQRPSDEPEGGRAMDFADTQMGTKKTQERLLDHFASTVMQAAISPDFEAFWEQESLFLMPHLQLTELTETPAKPSGVNTRAETPREPVTRSRTPLSRSDTPSGRKRLLEADSFLPALQKRQRLTPLRDRDATEASSSSRSETANQVAQIQDRVKKLEAELEKERLARQQAERARDEAYEQVAVWKQAHAEVQRRYEKRMVKGHKLERDYSKVLKTRERDKARNERIVEDDLALKQKNAELQKELAAVRAEIKAGGGDAAALETAREEARTLYAKSTALEKNLENTRKDFDFTRTQYQEASNKAAEFATQIKDLEEQVASLSQQAGTEKLRLKETSYEDSITHHLAKIAELEQECKTRDMLVRKLEEENRNLKRNRGIQTRGSSVQPPGSPGLDGHSGRGTRSRQGSPAQGMFANSYHTGATSRGSLLRHER